MLTNQNVLLYHQLEVVCFHHFPPKLGQTSIQQPSKNTNNNTTTMTKTTTNNTNNDNTNNNDSA